MVDIAAWQASVQRQQHETLMYDLSNMAPPPTPLATEEPWLPYLSSSAGMRDGLFTMMSGFAVPPPTAYPEALPRFQVCACVCLFRSVGRAG
jgi:hypothetical protein